MCTTTLGVAGTRSKHLNMLTYRVIILRHTELAYETDTRYLPTVLHSRSPTMALQLYIELQDTCVHHTSVIYIN